jgi:hypothetical protein
MEPRQRVQEAEQAIMLEELELELELQLERPPRLQRPTNPSGVGAKLQHPLPHVQLLDQQQMVLQVVEMRMQQPQVLKTMMLLERVSRLPSMSG